MANPEHLKLLLRGVDAWNEWRIKEPSVRPDLEFEGADLRGADLSEADLSEADLRRAILNLGGGKADLLLTDLIPILNLDGEADLSEANLRPARKAEKMKGEHV
jgi:hypothetical protein